jgi:hypothetical protein
MGTDRFYYPIPECVRGDLTIINIVRKIRDHVAFKGFL